MTLYEFIKVANDDYDACDDVFDAEVTVCAFDGKDETSEEYYEKFRIGIMRFVEIIKKISDCELLCKWTDMITRNSEIFREFADKYWDETTLASLGDEDDFICAWIEELDRWVAGNLTESMYKEFVENYMSRMV